MTRLSRLAGRPAEPDPLGGYRIPLARGVLRILPPAALFPDATSAAPLACLHSPSRLTDRRRYADGWLLVSQSAVGLGF
jgi:hypothetical protein